jgi:hypothetical protein
MMGKHCAYRLVAGVFAALVLAFPVASQPTLERFTETEGVYLKRPVEVGYEVRWHGALDAYVVLPPEFEDVDWADMTLGPSEAFVRDGENVVRQTIVLTPQEVGTFEVPEIRVGYLTPGDLDAVKQPEEVSAEQEPEREIPKLRAAGFTVEVQKDRTLLWAALAVIGAGLLLYLGGMGIFLLRRTQEAGPDPAADASGRGHPADLNAAGLALHEAKRCRVDGDRYTFYVNLAKAAEMLGSEHEELAGVLQARAQKVGFTGYMPTEDDMETDYRAVARVLTQTRDEDEAPASR